MQINKQVKIMRGISGAGKSTYARRLHREAHDAGQLSLIVSADDFFIGPEGYKFDATKLGDAHKHCMQRFLLALQDSVNFVIVDNTNINIEDIAPYVAVGEAYDYNVEIIQLTNLPEEIGTRNIHGVSIDHVQNMHQRLTRITIPKRWKVKIIRGESA